MSDIDEILWSWGPGENRLALMARDRLVELIVDRPDLHQGSSFLGRVVEIDRRLDAAFVALGTGPRPGFLSGARALGLSEGQAVAVTVRADGWDGKGPLLVPAAIAIPSGTIAPALLVRPHPLDRLLALHPGVERIVVDDDAALAEVRRIAPALAVRDRDGALFEHRGIEDGIEAALAPAVALPGGGRLMIETTAALTAIDVDSGAGRAEAVNRAAVAEIARQLRLRALGGQVVIDFVSGRRGQAHRWAEALKQAVAADPVPTHVFGVSRLGLVELTRERRGPSLVQVMCERPLSCRSAETVALAALRRLVAEAGHRPGRALGLVVAPEVAAALAAYPHALAEAEARLCRPVAIRGEVGRPREDVMIEEQT